MGRSLSGIDFVTGHFEADSLGEAFATSETSVCLGKYTHVFVDSETGKPDRIQGLLREGLEKIMT